MKIWMIVAICAVVFLVCFLLDTLFKLLFPKSKLEKSKTAVRPARRSATFGVLLLFIPIVVLLFWMPEGGDTLLMVGCITGFVFGVILLINYFSVVIYYDEEKFLYKTLRGGKKEFHYNQIRGQRSLMTRGGINTILFVGNEEITLYSSMQNLNAFLRKAFFKWCEAKQLDSDSIENNPRMFTWFPDPEAVSSEKQPHPDAS